ncbi:hypothetical protein MPLB_610004 [Mesorhizobium sp. ORS 3324]|nr:hypothetical protein MPLB_610004 [Mesorhizobium sp. ORS 3324]
MTKIAAALRLQLPLGCYFPLFCYSSARLSWVWTEFSLDRAFSGSRRQYVAKLFRATMLR